MHLFVQAQRLVELWDRVIVLVSHGSLILRGARVAEVAASDAVLLVVAVGLIEKIEVVSLDRIAQLRYSP